MGGQGNLSEDPSQDMDVERYGLPHTWPLNLDSHNCPIAPQPALVHLLSTHHTFAISLMDVTRHV